MKHAVQVTRSSALATILVILASLLVGVSWAVVSPFAPAARAVEVCNPSPVWAESDTNELIKYAPDGTELSRVQMTLDTTVPGNVLADIAWSADGLTLYGIAGLAGGAQVLFVVDPDTGAGTRVMGLPPGPGNALSPAPDGRLYVPSPTQLLSVDPVTGASTVVADFPTGYRSAGDFLTLADGDILAVLTRSGDSGSTLFRIHPDGTSTEVGTVPHTFGAAQSAGRIYLAGSDGALRVLDPVPASGTGPLTTTTVTTNSTPLYGATSLEDAGCTIASSKSVSASSSPVVAGTVLTYTLTLVNNAVVPMDLERTDLLDGVLDDADWTSGPTVSDPGVTAALTGSQLNLTGQMAAGATVTVTYTVTVKPDDQRGDNVVTNYLVTTGEAPPAACAADNENCTTTPVLTVQPAPVVSSSKTVTPASGTPVSPGETLAYTLTFRNTGTAAGTVDYSDLLTDVVDDADLTTAPASSDPALATTDGANGTIAVTGQLAAGQTVTVTYAVTVKPDGQRGNDTLTNYLVTTGNPTPATCTTDNPNCTTNPLAQPVVSSSKTVTPASGTPVSPGETLAYTLTFRNTGTAAGTVDYSDLLTDVVDDADLTTAPASSDPALATTDGANGTIAVTGQLAAGQTVTVTYAVTVKPDGQRGNDTLTNYLVTTGNPTPATCTTDNPNCTTNPVDEAPVTGTPPGGGLAVTGGKVATGVALGALALIGAGVLALWLRRRRAANTP